jgi:hypothetical protein
MNEMHMKYHLYLEAVFVCKIVKPKPCGMHWCEQLTYHYNTLKQQASCMQIHCASPMQTFVQPPCMNFCARSHKLWPSNFFYPTSETFVTFISYNLHKVAQVVHLLPFFLTTSLVLSKLCTHFVFFFFFCW